MHAGAVARWGSGLAARRGGIGLGLVHTPFLFQPHCYLKDLARQVQGCPRKGAGRSIRKKLLRNLMGSSTERQAKIVSLASNRSLLAKHSCQYRITTVYSQQARASSFMAEAAKRQRQDMLDKWRRRYESSIDYLEKEFTEARIIRLASTKPGKLNDLEQAKQIRSTIKKLRSFLRDTPLASVIDHTTKPKKGWNVKHIASGRDDFSTGYHLTTSSRIAKIDLLIEDIDERISQLKAKKQQAAEALARSKRASMQFSGVAQDKGLAGALWHALETTPPTVGYVYLKRWTMPDGSCWFKVGITNNPDRREIEQNVLPVAAETIVCVDVGSIDRARAIEAVIHQVLEEQRITDANNRELFHLNDQQVSAVKAVLEKLV